ncbi:hypothetical protein K488DRAFT_78811 [Vararia minispora EC-137]|uniref:Uncharacterized protein n=1 Tax=Vararia minispora EC-137 TaxID=1314806 RepID=A0ACB8QJC9_9AGAM|nr:hypothetical protein K488DRAFT_78811 [Vararia minispora EC-137]
MRRGGSIGGARAASPTNTTYSGISNYRTESYRPSQTQSPPQDTRQIARIHYEELSKYLASYLANEPANSRSAARQKLTRLTRQQFQELSTDVYDELIRRKSNTDSNDIPFLPVRDDFHPKRNQARQKLATLPTSRFKDLSSDVYYELVRRYPEFKEQKIVGASMDSPGSTYDDYPSPDFPAASRSLQADTQLTTVSSHVVPFTHRSNGSSDYAPPRSSLPNSPPLPPTPYTTATTTSITDHSPQATHPSVSRDGTKEWMSQDDLSSASPSSHNLPGDDYSASSRRRPSEDYRRLNEDSAIVGRRPSATSNGTGTSGTNANMATSGIIIPAKSTIAEEEIEMPFARRGRDEVDEGDQNQDENSAFGTSVRRLGSLSVDRSMGSSSDDDDDREYFDKLSTGRGSVASERGMRSGSDRDRGGRVSGAGSDGERMRREYEFRIATMQSKIVSLEREAEERTRVLEDYRRRADDEVAERARSTEETTRLRERCRGLEDQIVRGGIRRGSRGVGEESGTVIEQLRSDTESLINELSDVSSRNEELILARESDAEVIRSLEEQVREWKRKYESAKTELRSIKATSQLYTSKPSFFESLPTSVNGAIRDVHITSFLTSIDALLTAGRSNDPLQVLSPMKTVISAVTTIIENLRSLAQDPAALVQSGIQPDELESLRDRAEATLGNLVAAVKTHATSEGMSPVSLLDAAASHVAAAVTDIGRTVHIRRTDANEDDEFMTTSSFALNSPQSRKPTGDVTSDRHYREQSLTSNPSRTASQKGRPPSGRSLGGYASFKQAISSPTFVLQPRGRSGPSDSGAEGPEEAWAELKPYLEAQTESIVYAIQSVLSGVRSPTPSPTLAENLTQIITIVSSIVAVCSDALPSNNVQGQDILHDLSEHANKLSEMQALPEITKESRQIMAKSSFAIANAMKGLQKL